MTDRYSRKDSRWYLNLNLTLLTEVLEKKQKKMTKKSVKKSEFIKEFYEWIARSTCSLYSVSLSLGLLLCCCECWNFFFLWIESPTIGERLAVSWFAGEDARYYLEMWGSVLCSPLVIVVSRWPHLAAFGRFLLHSAFSVYTVEIIVSKWNSQDLTKSTRGRFSRE